MARRWWAGMASDTGPLSASQNASDSQKRPIAAVDVFFHISAGSIAANGALQASSSNNDLGLCHGLFPFQCFNRAPIQFGARVVDLISVFAFAQLAGLRSAITSVLMQAHGLTCIIDDESQLRGREMRITGFCLFHGKPTINARHRKQLQRYATNKPGNPSICRPA